jgi:hypothetical protein
VLRSPQKADFVNLNWFTLGVTAPSTPTPTTVPTMPASTAPVTSAPPPASASAWDNAALGHRVRDCIVQKAKCNTAGTF